MNDTDFERTARAWLEDGPTRIADRAVIAALDEIHVTRQRRARRPAWRLNTMATPLKFAAAAAAIGVLAVVVGIVPRTPGPGGPNLVASPSPSPTAPPIAMPIGDLEAGSTYALDMGDIYGTGRLGRLIFTVPGPGWSTIDTWFLGKDSADVDVEGAMGFDIRLLPYLVSNINADPCSWRASALEPPAGPTVDDLVTALLEQPRQNASPATEVTLGGYAGKKLELSVPDDVDMEACDGGNYQRWYSEDDPAFYGPWTMGSDQTDTVYIIDVEGTRWVIDTHYRPGVSEADVAELEQLVASIRFELPAPSPSPSTSPSAAG